MINFCWGTKEKMYEHNLNWPQFSDYPSLLKKIKEYRQKAF